MDSASESAAATQAPLPPGAILAQERERQALSRADIAQRLHMSASQVEALEIGDYDRLPRGPFLRGFTRNYARVLGLDAEFLVGLLSQDAPREQAPDIIVPTQNIRFDPLGQRLSSPYVKAAGIAAAALVLGFAAMYWWLFVRPSGAPSSVVRQPAEVVQPARQPDPPAEPATSGAGAEGRAASTPPAPAGAVADSSTPPSSSTPEPAPAFAAPAAPAFSPAAGAPASAPPAVAAGEGLLRLSFRGAAWVEIVDARGKVLLSRTHPGGSSAEVAGKPPFNLVIGNAPEVRLSYNGRDVDLAPHTRVAVARFTLP